MIDRKHGASAWKRTGHTNYALALAALSFLSVSILGCGNPGTPQPPSLKLPGPVADLAVSRTGNAVQLRWTMTRRSTDKLVLKGDQLAVACRSTGTGDCKPVCALLLLPSTSASCEDALPDDLRSGAARLMRYEVRLHNHAGKDAGPSNIAYAAAGDAPPAVQGVDTAVSPKGIRVQWRASLSPEAQSAPGAHLFARIDRDRVLQHGESPTPNKLEVQNGVPQPLQQTLVASEQPPPMAGGSWTPDHTLDTQAALNRSYRYTVSLIEELTLEGHRITVSGLSAHSGVVVARDVFPPAVPQDLAAVANPQSKAIDLSWSASAETDLAGYFVYRRASTTDPPQAWKRVSGEKPVATPAWTDSTVKPDVRYGYSVTSVDASGNESARSAETEERLPATPNGVPNR